MSIHIENLSKKYKGYNAKKFYALRDVNLEIEDSTCLALIGQNGAGKTTLIKCLLGFLHYEQGKIWIDNRRIKDVILENQLGFMPEKIENLDQITGRSYIQSMIMLRGLKNVDEKLEQLLQRLSLEKYMDIPMTHCSKGNYKKILFLQAILHHPKLLILDEPTDGVDPISRRIMLEMINEQKSSGCYVIITTHLLSDIERVADQIVVLNSGCVIAETKREELKEDMEDWYIQCLEKCGEDCERM